MPATTRSPRFRPPGAPGAYYYLGRPAGWWITALHRQPRQPAARSAAD